MNDQDPFSTYRLNPYRDEKIDNSHSKQQENKSEPENDQDVFSEFRINNPEQKSFISELPRHAARIGSRVAETIGGIPGDIQDLIQSGVFYGLEKFSGKKISDESRQKSISKSNRLPTSSELKEYSEKTTKGYTKAKDSNEELIDDYAQTLASLIGPMKFRKALGVAALGTGVKKAADVMGLSKNTQEASKLGTMILASMFNPKGVKNLYTNYYNNALKFAPEGTLVSALPLEKKLNNLKKKLKTGIGDITENAVLETVEDVSKKIKDGKVDIREMMATNRNINKRMGDPKLLVGGENLFPELKKAVNDSIKLYHNPDFIKSWRSANEAFSGLHESRKLSRYINKHLGNKPLEKALFASIAETAGGYPEAIVPTLGIAGSAFLGIKGIELSKRIMSNPTLRKYYADVLKYAAQENSAAMIKSAEKLTNKIKEQEKN